MAGAPGRDVDTGAQAEGEGVLRTYGDAAPTVGALPRGDHSRLGRPAKIQHLGFGADPGTVAAVGTAGGVEGHAYQGHAPHQGIKGAQGAQVAAPAVAQHQQVEEQDPQHHYPAHADAVEQLAMKDGDGADPLEGGHAHEHRQHQAQDQHAVAQIAAYMEYVCDPQAPSQPGPAVGDHIDGADPGAPGAAAGEPVNPQDYGGPHPDFGIEHHPGQGDLQDRKGVRHGDDPQHLGGTQVALQQGPPEDVPTPVGSAEEQHQQPHLDQTPVDDVPPLLQPAAEGAGHDEVPDRPAVGPEARWAGVGHGSPSLR